MSKNYVKEYKGRKVPKWATHVSDFPTSEATEFYRCFNGIQQYTADKESNWVNSPFNELNRFAIPLPEEPTQEWVDGLPPVGTECEVTDYWNDSERPVNLNSGQEVKILMDYKCPKTGADGVIFTWIEGADYIRAEWTGNEKHFRPLKTQEQKDREDFINCVMGGVSGDAKNAHIVRDVAEQLFDAGFKAPEGE